MDGPRKPGQNNAKGASGGMMVVSSRWARVGIQKVVASGGLGEAID